MKSHLSRVNFLVLTPGITGIYSLTTGGLGGSVNGIPGKDFKIMLEGMDSSSGNTVDVAGYMQPSVDSVHSTARYWATRTRPIRWRLRHATPRECRLRASDASALQRSPGRHGTGNWLHDFGFDDQAPRDGE